MCWIKITSNLKTLRYAAVLPYAVATVGAPFLHGGERHGGRIPFCKNSISFSANRDSSSTALHVASIPDFRRQSGRHHNAHKRKQQQQTSWKPVSRSHYCFNLTKNFCAKFLWRKLFGIGRNEDDLEDFEMQIIRYRPISLTDLTNMTNFTRQEVKAIYRGFKQECPGGTVTEEVFKTIYAQFFPAEGDSSLYAHYVFATFDKNNTGCINFEDFINGLSILCRGTVDEKLEWTFRLYDIDGDGIISKSELERIVGSVYAMMGPNVSPAVDAETTTDHVNEVFKKLDLDEDGIISHDDFMLSCLKDETVIQSLTRLDTVFN